MPPKNGVNYPMDTRVLQKKTANALDRLDELEKALPQIVAGVNNSIQQLQQQHQTSIEILDAVIEALGQETIHGIMAANRTKRAEQQAEAEKQGVADALAKGQIKVGTEVSEVSIIVGKEVAADGSIRMPGRIQLPFIRVGDQFKALLKGKKVGESIDLPNGSGKFEVVEIYDVVPPELQPKAEAAPEVPVVEAAPAAPVEAAPVAETVPAEAPAEAAAPAESVAPSDSQQ